MVGSPIGCSGTSAHSLVQMRCAVSRGFRGACRSPSGIRSIRLFHRIQLRPFPFVPLSLSRDRTQLKTMGSVRAFPRVRNSSWSVRLKRSFTALSFRRFGTRPVVLQVELMACCIELPGGTRCRCQFWTRSFNYKTSRVARRCLTALYDGDRRRFRYALAKQGWRRRYRGLNSRLGDCDC